MNSHFIFCSLSLPAFVGGLFKFKAMVYYTSDWHLNESRIFDFNPFFRPFKSIQEQNETIIANINESVGENDTLIHLGDVSIDDEGLKLLDQIKCKRRYLILGNYDVDKLDLLSDYFCMITDRTKVNVDDVEFTLNHYPANIKADEFGLVGHVHGLWKVQPNMINVGVDAWHFKPVSEDDIRFTYNAIKNHYDRNVFPFE